MRYCIRIGEGFFFRLRSIFGFLGWGGEFIRCDVYLFSFIFSLGVSLVFVVGSVYVVFGDIARFEAVLFFGFVVLVIGSGCWEGRVWGFRGGGLEGLELILD